MQPRSKSFWLILMLTLTLGYFNGPAMAQHSGHGGGIGEVPRDAKPYIEKLRVNDQGEVKFSGDTRVGDLLLKRGKYRFEHVVEGKDHFVVFNRTDSPSKQADSATVNQQALRVRCWLEPLDKPAKRTAFYSTVTVSGERTVQRLQMQGENVRHVF